MISNKEPEEIKRIIEEEYTPEIEAIFEHIRLYMEVKGLENKYSVSYKLDLFNVGFNNSSKKISDDNYLIELRLFTPVELVKRLERKRIPQDNIHTIVSNLLSLIIWHEFFHISFGHCTIPKNVIIPSKKRQQFEVMCDIMAIQESLANVFICADAAYGDDRYIPLRSILSFFFIYFKELEIDELEKMKNQIKKQDINDKYLTPTSCERTHPFITIRFDYLCIVFEKMIKVRYPELDIDRVYMESINLLMDLGYKDPMKINAFYRRNKKYENELLNIDFDSVLQDVKTNYIFDVENTGSGR
nr:hypothetical protein [uncultured Anaerosporobacter sp.]